MTVAPGDSPAVGRGGAFSLIKGETFYNNLQFLYFSSYFSLLAQRKVGKRKGALRPAFSCASQIRPGPFELDIFSAAAEKIRRPAGAKGRNDKRFLESIESINGFTPTISIFGEQIGSYFNRRRSRR